MWRRLGIALSCIKYMLLVSLGDQHEEDMHSSYCAVTVWESRQKHPTFSIAMSDLTYCLTLQRNLHKWHYTIYIHILGHCGTFSNDTSFE